LKKFLLKKERIKIVEEIKTIKLCYFFENITEKEIHLEYILKINKVYIRFDIQISKNYKISKHMG